MFSSRLLTLFRSRGAAAAPTYIDKVNGYNPIAFWPLNETAGATAVDQVNSPAQDGTYTGVSLNNSTGPDGLPVGLWDGTNDYVNNWSTTFRGAFNGAEGTVTIWGKVSAAGVWADGITRHLAHLRANSNNQVTLQKTAAANTLNCLYEAGGASESRNVTTSTTGWFHFAVTWSATGDAVKVYFAGAQEGATLTGLGLWGADLAEARTNIGADNSTGPTNVWDGWLAHMAVWDSVLGDAAVLDLANPTG